MSIAKNFRKFPCRTWRRVLILGTMYLFLLFNKSGMFSDQNRLLQIGTKQPTILRPRRYRKISPVKENGNEPRTVISMLGLLCYSKTSKIPISWISIGLGMYLNVLHGTNRGMLLTTSGAKTIINSQYIHQKYPIQRDQFSHFASLRVFQFWYFDGVDGYAIYSCSAVIAVWYCMSNNYYSYVFSYVDYGTVWDKT